MRKDSECGLELRLGRVRPRDVLECLCKLERLFVETRPIEVLP
jgi:hypothetical protein